jgi:hypothetical protein
MTTLASNRFPSRNEVPRCCSFGADLGHLGLVSVATKLGLESLSAAELTVLRFLIRSGT